MKKLKLFENLLWKPNVFVNWQSEMVFQSSAALNKHNLIIESLILWNRCNSFAYQILDKVYLYIYIKISKTEINFLDTTVFKVDNKLRTKVHFKPTDWQYYLHNKSEHPNSTKKSIDYSQAHQGSIKFVTIKVIFITIVNNYLTR